MPMSHMFEQRLHPILREVVREFGTPFHIYDEEGIIDTGELLKETFRDVYGFREYFAVKATPNLEILKIVQKLGFGFDCSSIAELIMSRSISASGLDIMFTSNNTTVEEFKVAGADGGCILNLDDITLIDKVPVFPELICFRYNPGPRRTGNRMIGDPVESKYGVRHEQIVEAYRRAIERGAKTFGLHTMICSNQLDYRYMVETVKMLLEVTEMVSMQLGITFQFINVGGGIGIPYKPDDRPFNMTAFAGESRTLLEQFEQRAGYTPRFYMEAGRAITGPHGALVVSVTNRMSKYREYVGVDACMSSLIRPALYGAYHHITVLNGESRAVETVDVSGSLCENNDKFAIGRSLPKVDEGDILLIHDTGAHGYAMGFNYNGRLRPKELLLCRDGQVKLIRREETVADYLRTFEFEPRVIRPVG
ncbi:MAG TPA: diaminopimelate decarboxylase [Dehalococcoidia bacterium]|nr:diaminopimelate decarboxylase [Dehalococcoidia bacterium]